MKFTESNLFVVALWLDLLPEAAKKLGERMNEADSSDCLSIQSMRQTTESQISYHFNAMNLEVEIIP